MNIKICFPFSRKEVIWTEFVPVQIFANDSENVSGAYLVSQVI